MKNTIIAAIDAEAETLMTLSKKIWENPEMGWHETLAVEITSDYLRSQGFQVETGAYNMPTAIRAVFGSGHPVIGVLGEYDCLPGLSQKVDTKMNPVTPGGYGHGCGHNLLGVGCIGACVGLKKALEASGKEGTIIYYGCPAEEQMTGKGFMAKAGAFTECDFTITWHPNPSNTNTLGSQTGVRGVYFHFKGKTSHAAANPQNGRSALDAVQLMNIGSEFLREHVTDDVRIHYIITDGGMAPNIVPDTASVKYFVRALTPEALDDAFSRVVKCAEGAAMMTETTVTMENFGGLYPTLQNKVLAECMQEARETIPDIEYTEEELAFADAINRTSPDYVEGVTEPLDYKNHPLVNVNSFGSTDYGDVAHIVPGIQNHDCCFAALSGGHSWMVTACSGHSIGLRGMVRAAKVMAVGAYKLIENPELVEKAKAEFKEATGGKPYVCPIKDDVPWPYKD